MSFPGFSEGAKSLKNSGKLLSRSYLRNLGVATTVLLVNRAFVPFQKRGFDANGENDESVDYPVKQGRCCSDPVKTTKMAGLMQAKAWFTKRMVSCSLIIMYGGWGDNMQVDKLVYGKDTSIDFSGKSSEWYQLLTGKITPEDHSACRRVCDSYVRAGKKQ